MTPERIAEIRERAERATAGPWEWEDPADEGLTTTDTALPDDMVVRFDLVNGARWLMASVECMFDGFSEEETGGTRHPLPAVFLNATDAAFIAHARQDVPELLDALTALQQENARLRAALTEVTDTAWGEWTDAVDIARNALREEPRD